MLVFGVAAGVVASLRRRHRGRALCLPIIAAGVGPISQDARMTRSSVLEVIRQDYVRTARAKGIAEGQVISRHVLKNALIPILTMVGSGLGQRPWLAPFWWS